MPDPIVIWGAGAIGGTIGAYLAQAGHDVLMVDRVAAHVAEIRAGRLSIEGPVDNFTVGADACTPDELRGRFGRILLAVKAQDTAAATQALLTHLHEDGFVLSCQNGLNPPVIADIVGAPRTLAAQVAFAPDWLAPGRILLGNRGPFAIGELDGQVTPRLEALLAVLRDFEPGAEITTDIYADLWSKMALAVLLKASALTNDTIADFITRPDMLDAQIALVREVVAVAHALGLHLHAFQHFDPEAFPQADTASLARMFEAHATIRRASAKQRSGIWRDLAVRRRKTEVPAQLAPIRTLARRHGIATPMIDALEELILRIEAGQAMPGDGLETTLSRVAASG
ncbi:NAD/NADP octopine/nopaline dehydrogenase family protein [Roseomonas sp. HJA6]|uniref:2-dehydropantoate 2-reductase n=1 Tax=Roseomonas alba TaxID=2846776 RepID=A0ABS7ADS6_9PROT|nr:NAD/NADP octopine/nopaline dehydrogenase family protein [Neoroseomonas alba]MBW6400452.1 NAD/NADP octopine/nopaline dehydrogenase family protein [Neoroseomonas alba]